MGDLKLPSNPISILVVDDNPDNLRVMMGLLENSGYKVRLAVEGELALSSIDAYPPDLILLDVNMPGMDGYETCRRIKAKPDLRSIPIIFVTAKTDEVDEEYGLRLGAVDYVTKPVNLPIFLARVRNHLDLAAARRQLEKQNQILVETARLREEVEQITKHDLKNPLAAVIGCCELLEDDSELLPEARELARRALSGGHRILDMINRSVDLYKMERGTYEFSPARVDLAKVIRSVNRNLAIRIGGASGRFDLRFEQTGEVAVEADELLCHSLFSNLMKNALEASPSEHRVWVDLESEGDFICARIHNRGAVPGIMREHFFEKFTTSGKLGGTGLGTYSARILAETQGGRVELDTSDAGATSVRVWLLRSTEGSSAGSDTLG